MWGGVEFWVALATLITFVESQLYRPYDCRRPRVECNIANGGQCNLDTGECLCTNVNFRGANCGVATNTIQPAGSCGVTCALPNICSRDAVGVDSCVCIPTHTGTNCTQRRVSSTCTGDNIVPTVVPLASQFGGKVYVSNRLLPAEAACNLVESSSGIFTRVLSLDTDPANNPCSRLLGTVTRPNGNIEYTYSIRVQYDNDISTIFDEEHEVNCIHDPNGNVVSGINVRPVLPGVLTGDNVTNIFSVTRMEVWDIMRGINIGNTNTIVTVGDDLELRVILFSTQLYANHYVNRCTAYDGTPTRTNRVAKTLIIDGCPVQTALNVVRPPSSKNGSIITIPIEAFKFDATSIVWFECSVTVCSTLTDPDCAPTPNDCAYGGANSRVGRKKRQASDGETLEVKVEGQFLVVQLDVNGRQITKTRDVVTQESCLQSIPFVAVTVVFAVLLLFTLAVAIFLCIRHSSRNRRNLVQKEAPKKGFHNFSMSNA